MEWLPIFYWCGAITAIVLQIFNQYYLSQGELKKVYVLSFVCAVVYIITETTLALSVPGQLGIILYNVVNVWTLISAVRGMKRLKTLSKEDMD